MELPSSIPTVIDISEAKPHDVNFLDRLIVEQGAIYVMDLGYMDYERLFRITKSNAFFVTRVKKKAQLIRRYGLLSQFTFLLPLSGKDLTWKSTASTIFYRF